MKAHIFATVAAALALSACGESGSSSGGSAAGGTGIQMVGSSTVFPFATVIAEQFKNKYPDFAVPTVESTGTGAGISQFCKGKGDDFPDIANASRRIKKSEYEECQKNGVGEIVEVEIGIDGIALGESVKGPAMKLTRGQIYKALAANPFGKPQTAKNWSDIDPALPNIPIVVYGPPSTSGTRDAFVELIMVKGCEEDAAMKALKDSDKDAHKKNCETIREDTAYVDTGENDNLIVQKLEANPNTLGIFGYSYMEENAGKVRGVAIDGIEPTAETIASFKYPGSRPLFLYVKKAHVGVIPGIAEFVALFAENWGAGGKLANVGMIPSPAEKQTSVAAIIKGMTPLDPASLK